MTDDADQLIMTKTGLSRLVHFRKINEAAEVNAEMFAAIVRELTGEWVSQIECEKIQSERRFYYDEVVYFGDRKEL